MHSHTVFVDGIEIRSSNTYLYLKNSQTKAARVLNFGVDERTMVWRVES